MTIAERIELSDSLDTVAAALEKARLLHQTISDFFSHDEKTADGVTAIRFDYHRTAVFHDLLGDVLATIEAQLPSSKWIDTLRAEDDPKEAKKTPGK